MAKQNHRTSKRRKDLLAIGTTVLLSLCLTGCPKTSSQDSLGPLTHRSRPPTAMAAPAPPTLPGPPGLPAHALANLGSPDAEIHYAIRGDDRLLLTRAEGNWIALAKKPITLGPAPDSGAATLHQTTKGYALAWTDHADEDGGIWLIHLKPDGTVQTTKHLIGRTGHVVRWLETFELSGGIGLIAESATGHGKSQLHFMVLGEASDEAPSENTSPDKKPTSLQLVAEDVAGWQVASAPSDCTIAWVGAGKQANNATQGGQLFTRLVSPRLGSVQTVLSSHTALADVQLARSKSGYQVAWTDVRGTDPHIYGALIEADGSKVSTPRRLLQPVGQQVLVALLGEAEQSQSLLAWERPGQHGPHRVIRLQQLDGSGSRQPHRALMRYYGDQGLPQFATSDDGYIGLTLAPLPVPSQTESMIVPSYVRFSRDLKVVGGEPIRVNAFAAENGVPATVHRLRCDGPQCSLLGRGRGTPTTLVEVDLPARNSPFEPNAATLSDKKAAELVALRSAAMLDQPLADIDSITLADGRSLVAWITHVTAEADGKPRPAPAGATLSYRFVSAAGKPGPVHVLSKRAISLGGVSLVASTGAKRDKKNSTVAVLAWAGPARGASQVYVTKISGRGKKLRQTTVTKIRRPQKKNVPNEVADVFLARDPRGGFVLAWSDSRNGQAEIYATRLTDRLDKRALEKRITKSAAHAHEPNLVVNRKEVLLAWSQSDATSASILVRALDRRSLHPKGAAQRVGDPAAAKDLRLRSPKLSPLGKQGALLGYIHQTGDAAKAGSSTSGLSLVELGAGGTLGKIRSLPTRENRLINSFALGCDPKRCRGMIFETPVDAGDSASSLFVHAFSWSADQSLSAHQPQRTVLDTLSRGSHQDAGLNNANVTLDRLFFIEDEANESRLRFFDLQW